MIISDGVEYAIKDGVIGLNLEWHYMRKKSAKEILRYIMDKRGDIFKVDTSRRSSRYVKSYTNISHTPRK